MKKFLQNEKLIKFFFLLLIGLLFIVRSLNHIEPYATGDGPEYVLTTEALYNHFTPDVRADDAISFKNEYTKVNPWDKNYKFQAFNELENFFKKTDLKQPDNYGGFYVDKNGKIYGYHFFFYSLLNVPGRLVAHIVDANPMICFQVTNAIIIIITCFILLFFSPFSLWKSILSVLIFTFSSVYWYLGWTHPEIYTICLVTLGFWFFFQDKYYLSILLIAIASLQNQPLVVMLVFMILKTIYAKGINFKNLLRIGLSSFPFILPPLFYFIHFGTTNLIKDAGFLSSEYITTTRVLGFYIDVNQGVILAIPLILITYFIYFFRNWILYFMKKIKFDINLLPPVFLIVMTCIVCMMVNWNHGQAIINRYASWFSAIIIIHTLFITESLYPQFSLILFNYFFMTQTFTILYHEQFNLNDWSQDNHRPLAKWLIEKHPSLYNPDPQIFITRTTRNYNTSPDVSPVFYIKDFNSITKIAVHKDKIDNLIKYGFSIDEINRIKKNTNYTNNWAYLNKGEFKTSMSVSDIYNFIRAEKMKVIEQRILTSEGWMKQIKEKAAMWGKSVDEVIKMDVEYMMAQEEKEK